MELYWSNFLDLHDHASSRELMGDKMDQAGCNLIKGLRRSTSFKRYGEGSEKAKPALTQSFCVYIPLKKSVQFDDELVNTFVYLRTLKESNRELEQDNFYTSIRKFLGDCKLRGQLRQGWEACLRRFVVGLDVLRRMEIFMELLKYGTGGLAELHRRFAGGTLVEVFMERVMAASKYLQRESRINKTWKISLEFNDCINEVNISKTMKMLYCSVCLIYDCGKHKLDDMSHKVPPCLRRKTTTTPAPKTTSPNQPISRRLSHCSKN
jgi:hypothetical protein